MTNVVVTLLVIVVSFIITYGVFCLLKKLFFAEDHISSEQILKCYISLSCISEDTAVCNKRTELEKRYQKTWEKIQKTSFKIVFLLICLAVFFYLIDLPNPIWLLYAIIVLGTFPITCMVTILISLVDRLSDLDLFSKVTDFFYEKELSATFLVLKLFFAFFLIHSVTFYVFLGVSFVLTSLVWENTLTILSELVTLVTQICVCCIIMKEYVLDEKMDLYNTLLEEERSAVEN